MLMKIKSSLLVAFGTLFLLLAQSLSAATALRIVAWNIEWFPGQQMREVTREMEQDHMLRVQETLEGLNPDILLSSEIRNWRFFDELVSVVPGLKVCVVSAFRDNEFGALWLQQVAIATKFPVLASWYEDWKATIPSLSRGFAFAAIEAPHVEDGVLLVYSLHLKSNRSWNEQQAETNFRLRNESVRQLLAHLDEMEHVTFRDRVAGVIVGGDINTNEDGQFGDRVVAMLMEAGFHNTWAGVERSERLTWRGSDRFEATTFDYIFTRGLPEGTALMAEVPADNSDHHAVVLELVLPE